MAATLLQEISQDEHEKARIRSRRMYEMDKYSDYHTAIEIGEIREREKWQGVVAENNAQIARNLLSKGSTPEFVSEITGLSLEDIAKL